MGKGDKYGKLRPKELKNRRLVGGLKDVQNEMHEMRSDFPTYFPLASELSACSKKIIEPSRFGSRPWLSVDFTCTAVSDRDDVVISRSISQFESEMIAIFGIINDALLPLKL
jgi:hypothetical protein